METLQALASILPVNAAGEYGANIDYLMALVTYIITPWVILTFGLIFLFCVIYRRRSGEDGLYVNSHEPLFHVGDIPIPKTAIIEIPTLCVLGLDLWIFASSVAVWGDIKIDQPEETAVEVQVVAEQFGWRFYYAGEDGKLDTTITRKIRRTRRDGKVLSRRVVEVQDDGDERLNGSAMVIPRGQKVGLKIASLDVIHSFFVPALRFKQDAVPGRNIDAWLVAEKLTRPLFREEKVVEQLQTVIAQLKEAGAGEEMRSTLEGYCSTLLQERGVPPYESIRTKLKNHRSDIVSMLQGGEKASERTSTAKDALSTSLNTLDGIAEDEEKYGFFDRQSYTIACAELCGYGHSGMTAQLVVMPQDRFEEYQENEIYN